MPIYEYQCGDCGHRMEAIQRLSDPLLKDCPACGKPGLHKRVSAAGFQLKGTGWYVTDFKDGGKKKGKDGAEKKGKEGGEMKDDSKPDAATKPEKEKKEQKKATASSGSDD